MVMAEVDFSNFQNKQKFDFQKYFVSLAVNIKRPDPILELNGKILFTRGNISCVSGKAKSRKSYLIKLFLPHIIENEDDNFKILIIDTEQGEFHAQQYLRQIHKKLEWNENANDENVLMYNIRELKTEYRLQFVEQLVPEFKPDLLIIDGIRDLVYNFNDLTESAKIVDVIMELSKKYFCHICCILHENKTDDNLRGHLGTEIQNKSETVITTSRVVGTELTKVSPRYCRNDEFEEFYFSINKETHLPEFASQPRELKSMERLEKLIIEVFKDGEKTKSHAQLKNKIIEIKKMNERNAEKNIKKAVEFEIIVKNSAEKYFLANDNIENEEKIYELPY